MIKTSDKQYWESYYKSHSNPKEPSLFAEFVWREYLCFAESRAESQSKSKTTLKTQQAKYNKNPYKFSCDDERVIDNSKAKSLKILELGCGNGRDSLYFANKGLSITAIDQVEIPYLHELTQNSKNPNFITGDFTQLQSFDFGDFDCIYSRFTLHSIDKISQNRVLQDSLTLLETNGILAIEARGEKNSLFGKGKQVEKDAFIYDNHYRRFLDFEATIIYLQNLTTPILQLNNMGGGGIWL